MTEHQRQRGGVSHMIARKDIEQTLRQVLPSDVQDQILYLSVLLTAVINQQLSPETFKQQLSSEPAAEQAFEKLAGRRIPVDRAIITFGEGSQMGDVIIRDIAGNNIYKFHVHVNVTNSNENQERKNTKHPSTSNKQSSSRKSAELKGIRQITERVEIYNLPGNFLQFFKIGSFAFIGLMFGWFAAYNLAFPEYEQIDAGHLAFWIIAAIIGLFIGLLIGISLSSKKKRASGVTWWGHLLGVTFVGLFSFAPSNNPFPGSFWLWGVLGWGAIWFILADGYKELR